MRYLLLMALAAVASGCGHRMACRRASDLVTRHEVEICERRECRDLVTKRFVKCPEGLR